MGSSGFWSDKVCYIRLGFLRNVTRRHGEYGGILKQALVVTEAPSVHRATELVSPILLAIYIQSVYPRIVIKNLYATPPSLFVPSAPP